MPKPLVLPASDVRFIVAEQLHAIRIDTEIALGPMCRDSAGAFAICLAEQREAGTAAPVVAADHLIGDMDAFVASYMAAAERAREGHMMTIGITPTPTSTCYIHPGNPVPRHRCVSR